jgi:BirA family biotin operon repressor/biotin-[acetyl-CoA-carboxylase] ligase
VIGHDLPPILSFEEIDSTNAEARRRAEAGEAGPLWITARRQTAGRGRRGRAWSTGTGNLAATLLLTTARPPLEAAQVAFVAALAVADAFDAWVPASLVAIKWPNDVLIDGRKASGVLIESGALGAGRLWLAVGCGLNLNHAPADVDRPATRVADHLRGDLATVPGPDEAMATFARAFAARLGQWEAEGFEAVARAWTARAQGLGGACVARLGAETVEGVAEGLEADGALRLRLASGELRRITAGDVFFQAA